MAHLCSRASVKLAVCLILSTILGGCSQPALLPSDENPLIVTEGLLALRIVSNTSFRDRSGVFHVVGEAINDLNGSVGYAFVHARFYDADGYLLEDVARPVPRTFIPSGERTSFDVSLIEPRNITRYVLDVTAEEVKATLRKSTLTVISATLTEETGGFWRLAGEVRNDAATATRESQVAGTLYDSVGAVVGAVTVFTSPADIPPRERAGFSINFYDPPSRPVRHNMTTM